MTKEKRVPDLSARFSRENKSGTFFLCLVLAMPGCTLLRAPEPPAPPPAVEQAPLDTTRFILDDPSANVVGELQVMRARATDTFIDIALAYDLGYDELVEANPGIDPWLPGEGTEIVLPSRFVLPEAPRQGVVLNVASKRLFYFPTPEKGATPVVHTFPISIGREGWATPLGTTKVVSKKTDPPWRVPASIRKEHAENGDPLPAVVPPGPDNPLGRYAMRLGLRGDYLIHGTNKPAGVGMRASHGCIRMNPDHIEWLYPQVPLGLPVHIVNQPLLVGSAGGELFAEAHPALEEDRARRTAALLKDVEKRLAKVAGPGAIVDYERLARIANERRGFPVSIMAAGQDLDAAIAAARRVSNVVSYDWFAEDEKAGPASAGQASDGPASGTR
jgi:L,D-transpeptidase ErfK/SrfK